MHHFSSTLKEFNQSEKLSWIIAVLESCPYPGCTTEDSLQDAIIVVGEIKVKQSIADETIVSALAGSIQSMT